MASDGAARPRDLGECVKLVRGPFIVHPLRQPFVLWIVYRESSCGRTGHCLTGRRRASTSTVKQQSETARSEVRGVRRCHICARL
eukprot:scaffold20711_cov90-Phaeocystis_antarctica.AAC.1